MGSAIRTFVSSFAVMALVAAPGLAASSERTETVAYEAPSGAHVDTAWVEFSPTPEARPSAGERYVSIELEDESGRPVAAAVHQGNSDLGDVCGGTSAPIALVSRKPVHVHIYSGPGCTDVSVPTQGTVTFTFTR